MLAWCITESLTADGTFDCDASDESYYFGVRFLDRVGFFDESKRFWTKGVPDLPRGAPEPGDVAARLAAALKSTGNESNTADDAMKILRTAECLSAIPRSIRELAKESAKPAQHGAGRLDSPECLGANCGGELKRVCERASL